MERNTWGYHLLAFVIVAIWGSTFVFTKLLLQASLSPAHIFTLRFTIAYLCSSTPPNSILTVGKTNC